MYLLDMGYPLNGFTQRVIIGLILNSVYLMIFCKPLIDKLLDAEIRIKSGSLSFAFIEGVLAQAMRAGDWLLLDELNLAPSELLESVSVSKRCL